jgi:hypothetical protein
MIFWKDFVLDEAIGAHLVCNDDGLHSLTVMEDGSRENTIQETRQEQRPARMAGLSSLESTLPHGTEADRGMKSALLRGKNS